MKKIISILSIIFGLLIIIGLSIWVGFPSPQYDRSAICITGYLIGFGLMILGTTFIAGLWE